MIYDIIILGSGPAGLAAAVAARGRDKSVLVAGNPWQDSPLARAEQVDNYPGLPGRTGLALLEEFYTQAFQALGERGVCSGAWVREGRSGVSTGIDFVDADQRALLQAGVVSGKYQGNTTAGYLSLRATLREMESEGWTCRVEPVYGREEPS